MPQLEPLPFPNVLTLAWLADHGAPQSALTAFDGLFGRSARLTAENLAQAAQAGLSLTWLATHLLSPAAHTTFRARVSEAFQQYYRDTAPARMDHERAAADADHAHRQALAAADLAFGTALATAQAAYDLALATALCQLHAENQDPDPEVPS